MIQSAACRRAGSVRTTVSRCSGSTRDRRACRKVDVSDYRPVIG